MIIDATWLWRWMVDGLAVTTVIAVVCALRPAVSAATRSLIWWSALLAVVVLPWSGALGLAWTSGDWRPAAVALGVSGAAPSAFDAAVPAATTLLVACWTLASSIALLRLLVGLVTLRRWRARCRPIDAAALDVLTGWRHVRGMGRRAAVVVSPDVTSPCVLGLWTPYIALPPSALRLRADALDAVLVHEYAHVQRRDDLAQFVQHLVVAVLALHPAAWWIGRMLTVEREAACDDWVVLLAAPRKVYTTWLLDLAADRHAGAAVLPVGIAGGRSQLALRVRRLADRRRTRRLRTAWRTRLLTPALVAILACVCGSDPIGAAVLPDIGPRLHAGVEPPPLPHVALPVSRGDVDPAAGQAVRVSRVEPTAVRAVPARRKAVMTRTPGDETRRGTVTAVPALAVPTSESRPALPGSSAAAVIGLAAAVTPAWTASDAPRTFEAGTRAASALDGGRLDAGASDGMPLRQVGIAIGDAGVAVGQGVARSGVATGGFFARLGKQVARAF